ncbi:MAG TPA: deoxyguanosinetriphosphate triphosphohydrolase [Phycisphaerae bacterium]|nr:deoxyguanosinetriphosphate triphosphohydrolase [Phycisphaerae bacterium]
MSDRPTVREQYEARQDAWLAPWAVRERDAGGRAFPENEHPYRTCFQRDRDRIVHCSAFRRLDFKTQVFVPHEHDHYRTRLTHTLEVAQIARDLGRALRANEDLLETVALAHDLGHPPFGHGGEAALDELMAGHGGFEHNRQSLRVVDYLEHPYPRFRGLNLTRVVRECLAKHETRYDAPVCEEFDPSLRAPLEGQLVDLADEIAYTAADLDDALAAEWISVEQLAELSLWRQAAALAETDAPDAREIHQRIRACKAVLSLLADDAIATASDNLRAVAVESVDDVRRAPRRLAAFSPEMGAAVEQMQQFLLRNVYLARDNAGKERDTRRILGEMFRAYLADPHRLPQRYRRRIERDGLHRVLCDYLAGMTDRFCLAEYAKLRS